MQFQEKRINQTQENDKKTHFGLGLGRLGTNLGCQLFFYQTFRCVSHYISWRAIIM